jgi:hypothetical protein
VSAPLATRQQPSADRDARGVFLPGNKINLGRKRALSADEVLRRQLIRGLMQECRGSDLTFARRQHLETAVDLIVARMKATSGKVKAALALQTRQELEKVYGDWY